MRAIWTFHVFVISTLVLSVDALEEGSHCANFDGSYGTCQVDRNCKWALDKLKAKEIKISQLVRCGLKGSNSIICCKDETITQTTKTTKVASTVISDFVFDDDDNPDTPIRVTLPKVPIPPSEIKKVGMKSEEACELIKNIVNHELDFHIIGGIGADIGEFPHMTAIGFSNEVDDTVITYDCGGSLISKNFVLTAGHCVNKKNRQPKTVKLGKVSLDGEDQSVPQDIPVKKVYLHESYSSRRKYNDIALLELDKDARYQKTVKPACLYTKSDSFDKSQPLEITGWGLTNITTNNKASWLQKANVSEIPLSECREVYKGIGLSELPNNLLPTQLCASGNRNGIILDACQGDSGGPIQLRTSVKYENVYYIVGITSFGASCGSDIPGVYTRVSEYLNWIENIVWPSTVTI